MVMSSTKQNPQPGAPTSPAVETDVLQREIDVLRREIAGLRASAQLRAVIEQAKGILVARDGITLDQAFIQLRRMSQEHNVRLVEVAATLVGVAVPLAEELGSALDDRVLRSQLPPAISPSTTWRELQRLPEVKEGLLHALLDTVTSGTSNGEEAARLLFDLLSPLGLSGLALYRTVLDGSLRAIGNVGLEPDAASAWRSIPLSFDIPLSRAVLERRPIFLGDRSMLSAEFPAVNPLTSGFAATAAIPVLDDDHVAGAVALMWDAPREFDEETRRIVTRSVARVASLLIGHASEADLDLEWLHLLLGLHIDPWILLDYITSGDGQIRHLIVQDVSDQFSASDWLGKRFLEIWPETASDGTWDALTSLVETGGRWTAEVGASTEAPWGIPGAQMRAVRLGSRVVIVWRPPGT